MIRQKLLRILNYPRPRYFSQEIGFIGLHVWLHNKCVFDSDFPISWACLAHRSALSMVCKKTLCFQNPFQHFMPPKMVILLYEYDAWIPLLNRKIEMIGKNLQIITKTTSLNKFGMLNVWLYGMHKQTVHVLKKM